MTNVKQIEKVVEWTGVKVKKFNKLSKALKYKPMYSEVWTCDFGQNLPGELSGIITCVVIQDTETVATAGSVVVLPIIWNNGKEYQTSVDLNGEDVAPLDGNHFIKGCVLPHQIRTLSKVRLGRKIGCITESGMEKIKNSMRLLICI